MDPDPALRPLGGAALDSGFGQALGNLGPAHGPRPGPGPMGPCPLGPGPARAQAQGALPIGPNGPWPIWGSKNRQKKKVLRMRFSIVENVRTPSEIVFIISRGLQLPYGAKSKKSKILIKHLKTPYFTVDILYVRDLRLC